MTRFNLPILPYGIDFHASFAPLQSAARGNIPRFESVKSDDKSDLARRVEGPDRAGCNRIDVSNGHWARSSRPAAHPIENVLRLLSVLCRRRAEYARLSGLPWAPGRYAGDQSRRDRDLHAYRFGA